MDMSNTNKKDDRRIAVMIGNKSNTIFNDNNQAGYGDQEDYMVNAFSWPPRSYACSFCKREFRSAQALGGHMNVHRKDRARLRQSPPSDIVNGRYGNNAFLNINLNQNPNPNFLSPLDSTASPLCPLASLSSSPYHAHNNATASKKWPSYVDHELDHNQHSLMGNMIKGSDLTITKGKSSVCGVREDQVVEGFARKAVSKYKSLKDKISEKKTTTVRLDLEIGLLSDHRDDPEIGRELDLELRLGYSN